MSSLEEFLADIAKESGAERTPTGEFKRGNRVFAAAADNHAEFLLDPEVADAALGTPSTSSSQRGSDWVRLTADPDQPHDFDRAKAWFLSAWRNAAT